MLIAFREHRQAEINHLSVTSAIGWAGLFNGFAGEDSKKSHPRDFLPFHEKESQKTSDRTQGIIKRLTANESIPTQIRAALVSLL